MFVRKRSPPFVGLEDGTRLGDMLKSQVLLSHCRMTLSDIELAERMVRIFFNHVLHVVQRDVVALDPHVVVLDEVDPQLGFVGKGLKLDRVDTRRPDD